MKLLYLFILTLLVGCTAALPAVTSFDECVQAGNLVMKSYPRQCRTQDGQHFVEDISVEEQEDETEVACTADAKLCPDGSSVGRQGPDCEFAPCPGE